jgi:hypothetical protein
LAKIQYPGMEKAIKKIKQKIKYGGETMEIGK